MMSARSFGSGSPAWHPVLTSMWCMTPSWEVSKSSRWTRTQPFGGGRLLYLPPKPLVAGGNPDHRCRWHGVHRELPYGWYEIYEYSAPEGFNGSGWDAFLFPGTARLKRLPLSTAGFPLPQRDGRQGGRRRCGAERRGHSLAAGGTVFGLIWESGSKTAELIIGGDGRRFIWRTPQGELLSQRTDPSRGFLLTDTLFPFPLRRWMRMWRSLFTTSVDSAR